MLLVPWAVPVKEDRDIYQPDCPPAQMALLYPLVFVNCVRLLAVNGPEIVEYGGGATIEYM